MKRYEISRKHRTRSKRKISVECNSTIGQKVYINLDKKICENHYKKVQKTEETMVISKIIKLFVKIKEWLLKIIEIILYFDWFINVFMLIIYKEFLLRFNKLISKRTEI